MKAFLKMCKRKYVLTALFCFGLVLAGFSVSGIQAQAAKTMYVTQFTGGVVVEEGTTVLPRDGHKLTVYSYPKSGSYLCNKAESWTADHTYYVEGKWGNDAAWDDYISLNKMYVDSLTMSESSLDMIVGRDAVLNYTQAPTLANEDITWASSNESVATVTYWGYVKAVSPGSATITVTSADTGKTASCEVTVTAGASYVPVESVSLNKTELALAVGQTETLTATVAPGNATVKDVTWSSSNDSVITVSAYGEVTAVGTGAAQVTVTTANGGKTASCAVTVTEEVSSVPVVGVSLNKETLDLIIGQEETLIATIIPSNATNQNVTWSSDRETVATVSDTGKVTAVGVGDAVIMVITEDGSKGITCTVTVTAPPSGGSIKDTTDPNMNEGDAVLDESTSSLSDKVLTDEDRQKIATGANVSIKLVVEDGQMLTDPEKELLQSGLGKNTLGMFLHIALLKTFEGETESQPVSETNGKIGIRIQVPENLLNTDSTKKREYSILREHNGDVTILPCTFDPDTKMLSFKTDRFSAYAIVYNDTAKGDNNTGGNTGGNNGNTTGGNTGNTNTSADNSGSSAATSTSTAAVKDEVPKTGESGQAFFWILLALCAVTGVMCLEKKHIVAKRKNGQTK